MLIVCGYLFFLIVLTPVGFSKPLAGLSHQRLDVLFGGAGEEVDGREFDHREATALPSLLHAHCGAGTCHKNLTGEGGVVDGHVELKILIVHICRNGSYQGGSAGNQYLCRDRVSY